MSKKLFAVALILGFATLVFAANADQYVDGGGMALPTSDVETAPVDGGGVSWFSAPKAEPNGWYWMYDNDESGPPFDQPTVAGLPSFYDITGSGSKLAPYNDDAFAYQLPDSFWYYGYWYDMEDYLYISPDGWVSLDPNALPGKATAPTESPPFPVPDVPNAVMAALWQDMNPTQTPDPTDDNRVYYWYDGLQERLIIQWYNTEGHANTNTYNFEVSLILGGQSKLMTMGACGVVFSYHFIHFLYQSSSDGWDADNGKTGIESETGQHGIYYDGLINNGRRIRSGYKRIFKHDVQAYVYLSPGETVLRWTEIEPQVVVRNIGEEVEHFAVTVDIYDENNDDELVYHQIVSGFDLMPGAMDTLVLPCWVPGELFPVDTHRYRKVAFTYLDRDECFHNDTLVVNSIVGCDGALSYHWNFADGYGYIGAYSWRLSTTYAMEGGALVTGGRIWLYECPEANYTYSRLELWEANLGCGAVANGSYHTAWKNCDTRVAQAWNEVIFDQPAWVTTGTPGNIWASHTSANYGTWAGRLQDIGLDPWPDPMTCYLGPGPGRSGKWRAPDHGASFQFSWGGWYYPTGYWSWPIELYTHLAFSPLPAPPCYYDDPHDLKCYEMKQPVEDYVEAGILITPELAIANIGRQAEPDADFYSIEFIVVEKETSDTIFHESSLMSDIGWPGDPTDDPDTTYGTTAPWTPEGLCDAISPFVDYELIGLVLLGEVGPDDSDHCPYNDTIRRDVTCLLSHDVGVTDIVLDPEPDIPPDFYYEFSVITITATVENFGYHMEHDIPVRCEITDKGPGADTLVYNNIQLVSSLDWRGNPLDNPYTTEVEFPPWTTPSENRFDIECRTEMVNDDCPDDDFEVKPINTGIEEIAAGLPFALEAITPNPFVNSTTVSFALPYTTNVSLKVYDITGKLVTTLVSGNQTPGRHSVVWNGTDDAGRSVAQGIYLVRMDAKDFSATKKVVLY